MRLPDGLVRYLGIAALFVAAAIAGTASGVLFAFAGDLPQIEALDNYTPGTITRVLGRDGSVIGEFATQRRTLVTYDQIPPVLRDAIVSAEDASFFNHGGLRISRIAVSAALDVLRWRKGYGASTLTQQLARKLFLTDDKTWERKIKEALLAIQIEKRYTKQEIFTMYCNQMYWGHYVYGVEAASELYFGKHVTDLSLGEAAMIAGIIQGNVLQSPYVNMKAAVSRRNYTLARMTEEGYITAARARAEEAKPIVTGGEPTRQRSIAPYFLENIRVHLEKEYGNKAVYEDGLVVQTGLDADLQRAANDALDTQLRRLDKIHGFRKPAHNLLDEKRSIDDYNDSRWRQDPAKGDILPAIVTDVGTTAIGLRVGRFAGTIAPAGYAWTHRRRPRDLVHRGDLVEVAVTSVDESARTLAGRLEQPPAIQGAVLALDNHTGEILAMIGGNDFVQSQFNRATQAERQVGSLFKPFVYTAAIDRGYTTESLLDDSPASFDVGPDQPPYEPQNYDREFKGLVTLREALEDSRNVPTIRLMDALGPAEVIKYARRLGITSPLPEYLSVAIGSAEASLEEITSAYTAFPNQGIRVAPLSILSVVGRDGTVLEQQHPQPSEALRADTAYIVTDLLEGVIREGTGGAASRLDWPLGGKTGTTDDYTDAWFVGFDPDITVGVWVGFDQKRSIGANETGAAAALPIWQNIMASWIRRQRVARADRPVFERPGNIVTVMTDHGPDVFVAGTEPEPATPPAPAAPAPY